MRTYRVLLPFLALFLAASTHAAEEDAGVPEPTMRELLDKLTRAQAYSWSRDAAVEKASDHLDSVDRLIRELWEDASPRALRKCRAQPNWNPNCAFFIARANAARQLSYRERESESAQAEVRSLKGQLRAMRANVRIPPPIRREDLDAHSAYTQPGRAPERGHIIR
jgi:hypothetical protein